jgi:hypothetical protein
MRKPVAIDDGIPERRHRLATLVSDVEDTRRKSISNIRVRQNFIADVQKSDPEYGAALQEFYRRCLKFNARPTAPDGR